MMDEKAKEARRAYRRKWAKNNPEKVKAQQERYWQKKAALLEEEQATPEQEHASA